MAEITVQNVIKNAAAPRSQQIRRKFYKVHERMLEAGFGPLCTPLKKGMIIYDRCVDADGIPNGKSSYSVFVWVWKNAIGIRYQNPGTSKEDEKLSFTRPHGLEQKV